MKPMLLQRAPIPRLRPFVRSLWATWPQRPGPAPAAADGLLHEHVLPTGGMHLVFRLSGPPLTILGDGAGRAGAEVGHAIVGGPRTSYYVKPLAGPEASVGALLEPGAAALLFGAPADALAECHLPLGDLWGAGAALALERLQEAHSPQQLLGIFEALLAERLPLLRALHPAVAQALAGIGAQPVGELVQASGYSHRHFIALFREAVGLAPKTYQRVLRLQQLLGRAHALARQGAPLDWAGLALDAGFADQPHFSREFRAFAGVAPEAYRRNLPASANHLAVPAARR